MRIWSLHPQYLDAKGLVALWREGLLAQHVLLGKTKGYKNHPQLLRFKQQENPTKALAAYLHVVCDEAEKRGYAFQRAKICAPQGCFEAKLTVNQGQLLYEWQHFLNKVKIRDLPRWEMFCHTPAEAVKPHSLFKLIPGEVESWEVV